MKLLAETEGIWTETAGGVTLAVAQKLIEQGRIDRDESIVVCITGNGLKTQEALLERMPKPVVIKPTLEEFEAVLETLPPALAAGSVWPPASLAACSTAMSQQPRAVIRGSNHGSRPHPHAAAPPRRRPRPGRGRRRHGRRDPGPARHASTRRSANGCSTATSCGGSSTST